MKRLFTILCAASMMLSAEAQQLQVKVTGNDGSSWTRSDFSALEFNDSINSITLWADVDTTLSMNQLQRISFLRDNLPWNLQWKAFTDDAHYMFGYGAIMHIRDVMTADVTRANVGYNWFSAWANNSSQGKVYKYNNYVWNYLREMVLDANQWIAACSDVASQEGLLGAAYASRALLYLDMARMYEFLPNDRTNGISASGQDVTGLTVPMITESTLIDQKTGYYNVPRATRQEIVAFIQSDLDNAEALLPMLENSSNLLPQLDVVYGLKARLYMWTGDYAKAQEYASKAIKAATTKPMTREEMLSTTQGFNDESKWMWGVKYQQDDAAVTSGIVNWVSWLSNEYQNGYANIVPVKIDKSLYDRIADTDVRKLLWGAPSGSTLDGQVQQIDPYNYYLEPYASVKFRPNQGSSEYGVGTCSAFPLMRVEEMYFIQAEAAAQQGNVIKAKELLNKFMQENRDPYYSCNTADKQNLIEEIVLQKRIELWGEGQTFFDVKRLNLPVLRNYEGTNFPEAAQFNTPGRPAWMNFMFPQTEENRNAGLAEMNNPDPSDVYQDYYVPLNEDSVRMSISGDVVLQVPKFVDKIGVLPLDSVNRMLFTYTVPKHGANVSFESQLQVSLSRDFPRELTKSLATNTGVDSLMDVSVYTNNLNEGVAYLLRQQGRADSGEVEVFVREKAYVQGLPTVQYASNVVSLRVKVSENFYYKYGYSYAPKLSAGNVGVLDMERLAGQDTFQTCNLKLEGEGSVYTTYTTDYPFFLDFNLWGMGFNVNGQGMADATRYPNGTAYVDLYKYNWGEYYTGHAAEYPGQQDYQATVSCMAERDGLVFRCVSDTFNLSVIINRQAWEEFDYSWSGSKTTLMKSEAKPEITEVTFQKDADANAYRLLAPYAKGHNLMIFAQNDSIMVMPRQYAYDDAAGNPVYASGTGTGDGFVFDMQVTFSYADSTKNVVCHEVYGERTFKCTATFVMNVFQAQYETPVYQLGGGKYMIPVTYETDSVSGEKYPLGYEEDIIFTVNAYNQVFVEPHLKAWYNSNYGYVGIIGNADADAKVTETSAVGSGLAGTYDAENKMIELNLYHFVPNLGAFGNYKDYLVFTEEL